MSYCLSILLLSKAVSLQLHLGTSKFETGDINLFSCIQSFNDTEVSFESHSWHLPIKSIKLKIFRSSHRSCSVRKGVLINFAKFIGRHLCQSLFFNKIAGLRPATLLKKRLWNRCFPVNFTKFLRTPFSQKHLRWLLLNIYSIYKCSLDSSSYFSELFHSLRSKEFYQFLNSR